MNGPHDLGGKANFGAVEPEVNEPLFHEAWEARVLGMTLACGALGHWSLDESRHARESLGPGLYLSSSYYQIWFEALQNLLLRHGEVVADELSDGQLVARGLATEKCLLPEKVDAVLAAGAPTNRRIDTEPRFRKGDEVRTINTHVKGHCRLPAYVRDKQGRIESVHEPHVFPDASAEGDTSKAQWLYTVVFDGDELWGRGGEPGLKVSVEAWESYLEIV